jgi:predicted flavoprotein YhiN
VEEAEVEAGEVQGEGHEVASEEAAEVDLEEEEEEAEAGQGVAVEEVAVEVQTEAGMRGVGSGQEVDSIANSTASA